MNPLCISATAADSRMDGFARWQLLITYTSITEQQHSCWLEFHTCRMMFLGGIFVLVGHAFIAALFDIIQQHFRCKHDGEITGCCLVVTIVLVAYEHNRLIDVQTQINDEMDNKIPNSHPLAIRQTNVVIHSSDHKMHPSQKAS